MTTNRTLKGIPKPSVSMPTELQVAQAAGEPKWYTDMLKPKDGSEPKPFLTATRYKTEIVVNLQVEGIHCWPECPIQEVAYLRFPHRHVFHIRCQQVVSHADRETEIIQLKHQIQAWINSIWFDSTLGCCNFESNSCEMIAEALCEQFSLSCCQVLEDGESGAIVTRVP